MKEEIHILHIAASISTNSAAGRLCLALRSIGCRITTLAAFPPPLEDGLFFQRKFGNQRCVHDLEKCLYIFILVGKKICHGQRLFGVMISKNG